MNYYYSADKVFAGAIAVVAFVVAATIFLKPKESILYGKEGKWIQDAQNPLRAYSLKNVGRNATWNGTDWIDQEKHIVDLGPPPPSGWSVSPTKPTEATDDHGHTAIYDPNFKQWCNSTDGKVIWHPIQPTQI